LENSETVWNKAIKNKRL